MENKPKLENEPNLGRCFKCIHFNKYYTRGVKKFNECKFGWCGIYHDHKKLMDNCPNYRFRRKLPIHQTNIMFDCMLTFHLDQNSIESKPWNQLKFSIVKGKHHNKTFN